MMLEVQVEVEGTTKVRDYVQTHSVHAEIRILDSSNQKLGAGS